MLRIRPHQTWVLLVWVVWRWFNSGWASRHARQHRGHLPCSGAPLPVHLPLPFPLACREILEAVVNAHLGSGGATRFNRESPPLETARAGPSARLLATHLPAPPRAVACDRCRRARGKRQSGRRGRQHCAAVGWVCAGLSSVLLPPLLQCSAGSQLQPATTLRADTHGSAPVRGNPAESEADRAERQAEEAFQELVRQQGRLAGGNRVAWAAHPAARGCGAAGKAAPTAALSLVASLKYHSLPLQPHHHRSSPTCRTPPPPTWPHSASGSATRRTRRPAPPSRATRRPPATACRWGRREWEAA